MAIIFSHQQDKLRALHCTGTTICFCTQYNTGIFFDPCQDLQPSLAFSSDVILVSLFKEFN